MEPTPTNKPIVPSEPQKRAAVPKPSSKATPAFVQPPMRFGNFSTSRRSVFPTETPKTTNAVEPTSKSAQPPPNGQVKNLPAARDRRSVFPETPNVVMAKENGASSSRFVQPRMRFGNIHEPRPPVLSDNPSTSSSTARCRCSRVTSTSTAGVLGIPIRRAATRTGRAPSKDSKGGENVEPGQQQE